MEDRRTIEEPNNKQGRKASGERASSARRYAMLAVLLVAAGSAGAVAQSPSATLDYQDPELSSKPSLKSGPPPVYPTTERFTDKGGTATLSLCVGADGSADSLKLVKSTGSEALDQATIDWIGKAVFEPGRVEETAVRVCEYPLDYQWEVASDGPPLSETLYPKLKKLKHATPPKLPSPLGAPAYPADALKARATGLVGVELCVSPEGEVATVTVTRRAPHLALNRAAASWFLKMKLQPAMLNGRPVGVCGFAASYRWRLPK
ncbi:MAG: energy transducer TonB [Hyphomonadaceae bacterium]